MLPETNIEILVERELDTLFNGLSPTIIALQKKKLGIVGHVPQERYDEFVEGVIIICKNMVGAGMLRELEERLRRYKIQT